jgi:hypothetical protein
VLPIVWPQSAAETTQATGWASAAFTNALNFSGFSCLTVRLRCDLKSHRGLPRVRIARIHSSTFGARARSFCSRSVFSRPRVYEVPAAQGSARIRPNQRRAAVRPWLILGDLIRPFVACFTIKESDSVGSASGRMTMTLALFLRGRSHNCAGHFSTVVALHRNYFVGST